VLYWWGAAQNNNNTTTNNKKVTTCNFLKFSPVLRKIYDEKPFTMIRKTNANISSQKKNNKKKRKIIKN